MRKILLIVIAAILVSVAIYLGVGADNYLLLRIGDWAIQMRLFVALVLAAGLAAFVWVCWSFFRGIFLGAWPAAWRRRRESNLTRVAIENMALSNWSAAHKELVRLANKAASPAPLVVLAAQSSEAAGDFAEAKAIYAQTREEFPDWSYVARVRLCGIAIQEADLDTAEALLAELQEERKNDAQLQLLGISLAEERRDWAALQKGLTVAAKKAELLALIKPIERRYFHARLAESPGAPDLLSLYEYASSRSKVPTDIISQLAKQLAMRGQAREAEVLVRRTLNKSWDESLVGVYAELEAASAKKQLRNAEAWLDEHPESEALLSGLKKLALRAGNDLKADSYSERLQELTAVNQEEEDYK